MPNKPKKKTAGTPSPDRLEMLRKSKVQAGKPKAAGSSKAATITRQMQNKGVKDGTIRLGKSGKSYNVYDANTGTWKRGVVKAAGKPSTPAKPKPTSSSRPGGVVRREASVQFPALKTAYKGQVRMQNGRKFIFDGKTWQVQKKAK